MPAPKNRTKKTNRNNVVFPAAPPRRGNFYGRSDVYRRPSRNPAKETKTIAPPRILARRGTLPLVVEATVSASARFSRYGYAYAQNDKLLGRVQRFIRIIIIKPNRTPVSPLSLRGAQRATWQSHRRDAAARSVVKTVHR